MRYIAAASAVLAMLGTGSLASGAVEQPPTHRHIVVTTSIQAAVDAAAPGDTVVVPAGTYREAVTVSIPGLTIEGGHDAVLDGTGLAARTGILVRSTDGSRLAGFNLHGLTIRDFDFSGVFLDRVDGFRLTGSSYMDNDEYGLFPVRSSGRVDHNTVSGSDDTGVYVGQSSNVQIDANVTRGNMIGIEVELCTSVTVTNNIATGNSVGLVVQIVPGLPPTTTSDIRVTGNLLTSNTRPNDITDPTEILSMVPSGIGLLTIGADRVAISANIITANPTAGVAVVSLPARLAALDPRLEPHPDQTSVVANVFWRNGFDPDPKAAPLPGADIVWDGSGTGNCASGNPGATTFPQNIPAC
jgi:parallel beta-helix repeat protein